MPMVGSHGVRRCGSRSAGKRPCKLTAHHLCTELFYVSWKTDPNVADDRLSLYFHINLDAPYSEFLRREMVAPWILYQLYKQDARKNSKKRMKRQKAPSNGRLLLWGVTLPLGIHDRYWFTRGGKGEILRIHAMSHSKSICGKFNLPKIGEAALDVIKAKIFYSLAAVNM